MTGGLAAGKTTVCRFLKECGAFVISADEIVHQLLSPHTQVGLQVIQLLGPDIQNGSQIDRKRISKKVFSHPEKLYTLEQIIHPAVFDEIEKKYQQIEKENKYPLFIVEIPLLYESKGERQFDAVVAVLCDPDICEKRFLQTNHHTQLEFKQRMAHQLDPEKKAQKSDYILHNNGTVEELRAQVKGLFSMLICK